MAKLEGEGGRLREMRERNILTQLELAELSGVHYTTISKLEHGTAVARPSTIRKLARSLGVTPQYLKGITDEPFSEDTSGA
jgi:transcriptional regulator with XRE-family HTH domain